MALTGTIRNSGTGYGCRMPPEPHALVDAILAVSGDHPGFGAVHAKGVGCAGTVRVVAGRLELNRALDHDAVEPLIFDPTHVADGIECSDDPILNARSGANGVSYQRRTSSSR
jgi:catalase